MTGASHPWNVPMSVIHRLNTVSANNLLASSSVLLVQMILTWCCEHCIDHSWKLIQVATADKLVFSPISTTTTPGPVTESQGVASRPECCTGTWLCKALLKVKIFSVSNSYLLVSTKAPYFHHQQTSSFAFRDSTRWLIITVISWKCLRFPKYQTQKSWTNSF